MSKEKQIEEIAKVLIQLTYDLRTNMTSVTRYVRHEKSKHPTLTEGQFLDRNLEYRELANTAVDNILKCLNDNEELRRIENICFEICYRKQSEGEWIYVDGDVGYDVCNCSVCGESVAFYDDERYAFCPNCGAKMKGGE